VKIKRPTPLPLPLWRGEKNDLAPQPQGALSPKGDEGGEESLAVRKAVIHSPFKGE